MATGLLPAINLGRDVGLLLPKKKADGRKGSWKIGKRAAT